MNKGLIVFISLIIVILIPLAFLSRRDSFELPKGETTEIEESETVEEKDSEIVSEKEIMTRKSERQISVTDGTRHSIPLEEILSGGPGKDGIPSIDDPKFVSTDEASEFLEDNSPGLGLTIKGESRFYPYQILVWHEIVNDQVGNTPALVTYCPLCATGVVFDPRVNGRSYEFGVSGLLWQSNLLMYNRTGDPETESLWSQVLGEAVLGPETGTKLKIIPSDTVLFGDWKKKNPSTKVLSRETGAIRSYGLDPYGDYYSNESVSFGATFNDDRLHPKAFVLGVELNGKFKAYHKDALKEGQITDIFEGEEILIETSDIGEVRMSVNGSDLPYIGGFWFSWLAVHPETELFK